MNRSQASPTQPDCHTAGLRVGTWVLIGSLMLGLTGGCRDVVSTNPSRSTGTNTTDPQTNVVTPTPVTLALNWFPEAEHGGFYAAQVHGYFADEGLAVTILPGGPKAPVIPQVASGQVTFGCDNADKLLVGRSQGADVVALLAPIQTSPRCLMLHAEAGLTTFEALAAARNFTLAMNPGQPFAQFLTKTLVMDGVTMVPYPGNLSQFLLDKRFGQQAYSFSEPFVAQQNGAKPQLLMLADLGFNTYTSLLLARGTDVRQRPDLLARMLRATQRGWQHYLRDPDRTNALIHEQNPEMSLEILAFGVAELRRLCPPVDADSTPLPATWGAMESQRWQKLGEQMIRGETLKPGDVDPTQAFTNQFFPNPPTP